MPFNMQYVTHGGFELVRDAWLFVSHLFASNDYRWLARTIFIVTVFFSALGFLFRGNLRYANNWMWTALMVVLVWAAFFQTGFGSWSLSGRITVHDDVKNLSQIIDDLPPGLVALAGVMNRVQTGMEDLVESIIIGPYDNDTSEVVLGMKFLREAAGGMLLGALAATIDARFSDSLDKYIDDCLATELMRYPQYREEIRHTDDIVAVFQHGDNPALYTVTYLDSSGNPTDTSEAVNCRDAWQRISAYNSKTVWTEGVKRFCKNFGFDAVGSSYTACRDIMENSVKNFVFGGVSSLTPEAFARNIFYGARFKRYLMTLDSSLALAGVLSSIRTQSGLMGTGIAAEAWIPHIKIVLETVLIGLTPLIFLFVVSAFSLNAITALFGLWIFFVVWAVTDKILEGFWIAQATRTWEAVSDFARMGLAGQEQFWAMASKSLAILGALRTKGMLLAGIFTGAILKFGGSALAHFAGGAVGSVNVAGAEAGGAVSPERRAQKALASSWMDEAALSGDIGWTNTRYLTQSGRARAMRRISDASGWGRIGPGEASLVGEQTMRGTLAGARAKSYFSDEDLFLSAFGSTSRSIFSGGAVKSLMDQGVPARVASSLVYMPGKVSLGSVTKDEQLTEAFAEKFGMKKSLFREIAAHTYLQSPRFDTNGKIQGATLRMMVPPEKAKAVADWLRKGNPIAARAIEDLAARGKTAVVTGDVEYGKPITGEVKAGFKVRELDLAQREMRSEFDMTPENPGYLYDPRTKELVAAFTSGKWTETGDSIVIRDAKTEDGIFFRELKIDKRTGRVATADFVAPNGKEASKMLGKLRMRNPDYISGRQLDELKRTKGPVRLHFDGKTTAVSGSSFERTVRTTVGEEVRVPYQETGEKGLVFKAPEGLLSRFGLNPNAPVVVKGGYSYDSSTQTVRLAPGTVLYGRDAKSGRYVPFYSVPASGMTVQGIDPDEFGKITERRFTPEEVEKGKHIDVWQDPKTGKVKVPKAEEMKFVFGGADGVTVSSAGIGGRDRVAHLLMQDFERLREGASLRYTPLWRMVAENPELAGQTAEAVKQILPVDKNLGQQIRISSDLGGRIGSRYAGIKGRGEIIGQDQLKVDAIPAVFQAILTDESVPLEERIRDAGALLENLLEYSREAGAHQRDDLTRASAPEALRQFGTAVKDNAEFVALGAAAAVAFDRGLDLLSRGPKGGSVPPDGPPGRAPDLKDFGVRERTVKETLAEIGSKVLAGARVVGAPFAAGQAAAVAVAAGGGLAAYELARKAAENEEEIQKLGERMEEWIRPYAEGAGVAVEELSRATAQAAAEAAKGIADATSDFAAGYKAYAERFADAFVERVQPLLNREVGE